MSYGDRCCDGAPSAVQAPSRFWDATSPYADPAHLAHLLEGLRKAGLEV